MARFHAPTPTPAPVPTPVDVVTADAVRDGVDWALAIMGIATGVAGIVGLFLAVAAYRVAKRQMVESRETIARERRTTLELELLRDMIAVVEAHPNSVDFDHYPPPRVLPGRTPVLELSREHGCL